MNLIQQEKCCRAASAGFGVGSTTLPKSGKRRVWLITGGVDCGIAKLGGDFKQQRGLANLPRPREKLDSAWRGFSEAFQEEIPTWYIVICEFRHSRIIIQIYLMNVKKRKAAEATPKKKDTELPCPEVAKEITEWSAADVVRSPASFARSS
jgi:hypothetical protein